MHRFIARTTLAIATLSLLVLAACGAGSSSTSSGGTPTNVGAIDPNKQYSISFWEAFGTGANKTAIEGLAKDYMAKHPNIKVTLTAYDSYGTLLTKLKAAIAAGSPPSLSQVYENYVTLFNANNANNIISLKPYIDGPNGLKQDELNDFFPQLLKDGQIDGTQYMLPFNKSDIVLYYNADMLSKLGLTVPKTWDDFIADATKATTADGSTWGWSYSPDVDLWTVLFKAYGGDKFISDDGKKAVFGDSAHAATAKQAMDKLIPLAQNKALHVTKSFDWQNDFAAGKSLFAISTIASYPFLAKPIGTSFKFDEAPLPAGPAGQFTVFFGTNVAIYANPQGSTNADTSADNQAAAWDFIKYLTSAETQATFVQQTGYMPVRQSAYNGAALQAYYQQIPARKVGPDSLKYGFVPAIIPAWDTCRTSIAANFAAALNGQVTSDQAVTKMTTDCQAAIDQG